MSSVQSLREFISERLTAAAEEIFTEFEKTIVQYEEEIDRQRRLLDITWKPQTHLHTTEPPKRQIWKGEEVLTDLQLRNHDRNSSLDQEEQQPPVEEPEPPLDDTQPLCDDPEAPQMKEEEEELCSSQDEGQFLLKHEAEASTGTPAHEDRDHWEPDPNWDQLLSQNVPVPENRDQGGFWTEDPNTRGHRDDLDCLDPKTPRNAPSGEKQFSCDFCGKGFFRNSILMSHVRTHTGERPFTCLTCGKGFTYKYALNTHMISHMGVRPYTCVTCGKGFKNKSILTNHFRIHTGEMPFSCQICGTSFNQKSNLVRHMRIHTGEKPFSCHVCGKSFNHKCNLIRHMTTHRGPKV